MPVTTALLETDCPNLKLLARGKVRDIYEVPGHDEALLFVATDRVSAFDVIMKNVSQKKTKLSLSLSVNVVVGELTVCNVNRGSRTRANC